MFAQAITKHRKQDRSARVMVAAQSRALQRKQDRELQLLSSNEGTPDQEAVAGGCGDDKKPVDTAVEAGQSGAPAAVAATQPAPDQQPEFLDVCQVTAKKKDKKKTKKAKRHTAPHEKVEVSLKVAP